MQQFTWRKEFVMSQGAHLISAERKRQEAFEGYTAEHDEFHERGEIAVAAIVYVRTALTSYAPDNPHAAAPMAEPPADWPWEDDAYKPTWSDPVRNLVKAGALIAAEIDRLQAAAPKPAPDPLRLAAIAACPEPFWHETHRYCPACPWTEADEVPTS